MRSFLACVIVILLGFCSWVHVVAQEDIIPSVTVEIPMRDGTKLPTDIYLPDAQARNLPCVLVRAPNGRRSHHMCFAPLAKQGYAVAIQDTRSRLDLEGKTWPFLSDGWGSLQDGYDTVQWLAESPYTNGKIGTIGISAQGITQLLMAPSAPPNLVCQHIGVAAANIYDQAIFAGGQLRKHQVEGWLGYYAPHPSVLKAVALQPLYNDFWAQFDSASVAHRVQVPAVHHGGWYDTFCQGTIDSYLTRQEQGGEGARGQQKMVIGPWTHWWCESTALGDFETPESGRQAPVDYSAQRWFDHYLKGVENDVEKIPNVTYYVMGPFDGSPSSGNVWRYADHWPPPAQETSFFFAPEGKLVKDPPSVPSKVLYSYDPANPTPTLGGRNLFLKAGPVDQTPIEGRNDVVVFTTDSLQEDVEVTGRVLAKVLFSSDQRDTDVVIRLCDVYPDGRSILIADGIRRLADVVPRDWSVGKVNGPRLIEVDLWSTSIVFAKGHKIRVSVASSNYPRYENNVNSTTDSARTGNNTLYLGGGMGSRIILPIVPLKTGLPNGLLSHRE